MKNIKKQAVTAALAMIAGGFILVLFAFTVLDLHPGKPDEGEYERKSYPVTRDFRDLQIEDAEGNIRLLPAEDGQCRVECTESRNVFHRVDVENNTLMIKRVDRRKWYERMGIGIYWEETEVTVYLPQSKYGKLCAGTASGDIEVAEDLRFDEAEIESTSGSIRFAAAVKNRLSASTVSGKLYVAGTAPESLKLQSTSGSIGLEAVKGRTELEMKTVSGSIKAQDIQCVNVSAESTSGKISFQELYASGTIRAENTSGNIELLECDGESLTLRNTSGKISGRLASEKQFFTDTVSGSIDVPRSATGGKCEAETVSGNIEFTIG